MLIETALRKRRFRLLAGFFLAPQQIIHKFKSSSQIPSWHHGVLRLPLIRGGEKVALGKTGSVGMKVNYSAVASVKSECYQSIAIK
jgi:hypothetical protein